MSQDDFARIAWCHRNGKTYKPRRVTEPSEPTDAAIRMEEEFERRRGDALAFARRQARLKPYKLLAVKLQGGKVKP